MQISDVSVPDIYKDSADFRFFLKWFETALTKVHYDTEHADDLQDPLKCPDWLLWMLADTMGFKYDSRLPVSFNRLVLVYFMSMIRNRGSRDGVTLAAEVNLKQFDIETVAGIGYEDSQGNWVEPKDILFNRLEDTSIPVNSVSVTPYTSEGYIDVVYFSDRLPTDACIEYVRPLGMYMFQHAGVVMNARTKIGVDVRLTNTNDIGMSIGPTHVGHYSRDDYARLQRLTNTSTDLTEVHTEQDDRVLRKGSVRDAEHWQWDSANRAVRIPKADLSDTRRNVWYRNADYEGGLEDIPVQARNRDINPGYRALYSLQLCNNEHIVRSLVPVNPLEPEILKDKDPIFGLGWKPQDVETRYPDDYVLPDEEHDWTPAGRSRAWNLRVDRAREEAEGSDVYTVDPERTTDHEVTHPRPMINPIMHALGDAMSLNDNNNQYIVALNPDGTYPLDPANVKNAKGEDTVEVHNGTFKIVDIVPDGDVELGRRSTVVGSDNAVISGSDNSILQGGEIDG